MPHPLDNLIRTFGSAPETQMDANLAKMCRDFDFETGDTVRFLRDLRDLCVFSGSSEFCVLALSAALSDEPAETAEEKATRHAVLDKLVGL